MAVAKAEALEEVFNKLQTLEGQNKIFRIAKAWDKETKDFTQNKQIKSCQGVVVSDREMIKNRCRDYFESLLNEQNPREFFEDGAPNEGLTSEIKAEVQHTLKKMKNGKMR